MPPPSPQNRCLGPALRQWCCTLALWLLAVTISADARAAPRLFDVQLSREGDETSVAFIVDDPLDFRLFTLAAPLRLVLDLPSVEWRAPPSQLTRVARQSNTIKAVRRGSFRPGTLRIVFDLEAPIRIATTTLERHGQRYALVLRWRAARQYAAQQVGNFREIPLPPPRPVRAERQPAPLIVIDAGHGGVDPGATGRRGTHEKDVTLAMALQLRKALLATGRYRATLTRTTDRFLRLRDRNRIARRQGANLFISLHADSAPGDAARGLSVYTLSDNASDREAASLAQRENKADVLGGLDLSDEQPDVVSILIDLAQRETRNRSLRIANQLVRSMVLRVPLLERPHRQAGFAVLKAPDIPAVLIELGFLSNPEEEKLLLTNSHRVAIIEGIVAAIDNFFSLSPETRSAKEG